MRTFAMVAPPGTFLGDSASGGTGIVVGRAVANTEFLRALGRWGTFDRFLFFVGEAADVVALEAQRSPTGVLAGAFGQAEVTTANLITLPEVIAAGEVDVIHLGGFSGHFADLVWLRDRYAQRALPITVQIHSLSYPRFMGDYLRALLHPPGAEDAVVCSSLAGRAAVEAGFARAAAAIGRTEAEPGCALPVIPLGVNTERMTGGKREKTRARFGLSPDVCLVLGMGRFTEYDKMDLFPLLQAFRSVVDQINDPGRKPVLLLAGARQGTKTPEMVRLWAKLLGIADRVLLEIDFPESEKANLLAAADVFVSPSDNPQETFGLSVVEAMAAGLPVVVSDFDGYKDTVSPDVGIRVPARAASPVDRLSELGSLLYERPLHLFLGQTVEIDLPALEAALLALVEDPARRRTMGAAAAARAQANYDWRVVIPRYEALWRSLATAVPPKRRPTPGRPPLAMDFDVAFASFPSEVVLPTRRVVKSALARTLVDKRNQYIVYPELRNIFADDDVIALLALAAQPITLAALGTADASRRPGFAGWRRNHAIAWLLKHGLLEDAAA